MRRALFAIPCLVLAAAIWYGIFSHQTPPGQPPLATMDLAAFQSDFNAAADRTRVVLLLSPT